MERFREIKEAYEVLSDKIKRTHYDATLKAQQHRPYAPSYDLFKYKAPPDSQKKQQPEKTVLPEKNKVLLILKPLILLLIGLLLLQLIIHPPGWLLHYLGK